MGRAMLWISLPSRSRRTRGIHSQLPKWAEKTITPALLFQGALQDLRVVDPGPGQDGLGIVAGEGAQDLHEYLAEVVVDAGFQVVPPFGAVSGKRQGQVGGDQARVPGAGLF